MPDSIQNLRDAHAIGLPYAALWPVDGFDPAWHAAQLKAGRQVMPSIRLPDPDYWQASNAPDSAVSDIVAFNVPLTLRTNNIRDAIVKNPRNRSSTKAGADLQGAVYSCLGSLIDQEPFCDALAPFDAWFHEGQAWSRTAYYAAYKQIAANVPLTILIENNEGAPYEQLSKYLIPGGTIQPPLGVQYVDTIRKYSERMADWVKRDLPNAATLTHKVRMSMVGQYASFYSGFGGADLTAGYGGVLTNMMVEWPWTEAYMQSTLRYDAASPNWYINSRAMSDFTNCRLACVTNAIPAWEQAEARNPRAWRELSVQLTNGAALAGALAGRHKPITPELWGGYCEFLLWAMQSADHRACVLRHYEGSFTKPTDPFFAPNGNTARLGVPEMQSLTYGDYVLAEAAACEQISNDPLLRDFWLHGTPITTSIKPPTDIQQAALKWPAYPPAGEPDNRGRLLPCSVNDLVSQWKYIIDGQSYTGTVKVWACATKHPDGRILIYAWTACDLGQVVLVTVPGIANPVTVDLTGKSSAYVIGTPAAYTWGRFHDG